ncbi:hypothetical protein BH721_08265 [Clostridium baratii]|uniref:hypothetical protein n=1 Tax=Clostridium baratii TaxID=1561 RepID=UPI0009A26416|nr:hypothetical protein [Clostridium baratii]OPF50539.1 hypothetical protein A1M12_06800 [Clostridium baratii]OPF54215.1 hypothetical protein BH721_08265 [Clostridium baratii]OPF58780.1 hypothetical protein BH724_01165 [Clostridium baratii]OPF58848.1 hypothetical protein BH725_09475 [Clostridium baratii]
MFLSVRGIKKWGCSIVKKVTTLIVCAFLLLSGIYGCTDKKEKNIFKESDFNELGTFPIIKYEKDNKLFLQSSFGIKIYDTKNGEIIPVDNKVEYLNILWDYTIVEYNNNEKLEKYLIKHK